MFWRKKTPEAKATAASKLRSFGIDASSPFVFKRFFNTATFSDVTIHLNNRNIACHRIILASQSEWFSKAFEGKFREASAPTLELQYDDPRWIMAMLQYMYGIAIPQLDGEKADASCGDLLDLLNIYAVASKYVVPGLTDASLKQYKRLASTAWVGMWTAETLKPLIEAIYSTCPSPNDAIRTSTVDWTCANIDQFTDPITVRRFRALLEDVPDFGADVALRLADKQALPQIKATDKPADTRPHKTVLHWAAQAGDVVACRQLLADGMDVNFRDENDETPLHFSTWFGKLDATRFLVESGADINASSREYNATPLQWATSQHYEDICQYLRDNGAEQANM